MKTSLYTILCIIIRLGAVLLAVWTVIALPNLYFISHTSGANGVDTLLMGLLYAAFIVLAFLLWLYPGVLASVAAGRSTREAFETPLSAGSIQYIAFSVLGMALAMKGLIALVFEIARWATLSIQMPQGNQAFITVMPEFAADVAQIVIGVALVVGAKGLIGLLRRFRYGNQSWEES